jgi:hypothetical protein
MTDNTELQRLIRLRRLGSQIAASLPSDLDREQAFQVRAYVCELLERQYDRASLPPQGWAAAYDDS